MSDSDHGFDRRGGEPPLTIDSRRQPRSRGPAPVALVVSVVLLAIVAGAVAFMYRSGTRAPGGAPEPLGAPLGDVRAPAPPQAATSDPGAGLTISKDDANAASGAPNLAPPPEQPLPPQASPAAPAATTLSTGRDAAADATVVSPPAAPKVAKAPPTIDGLVASAVTPDRAKAAAPSEGQFIVQIGAFSSESLADKEWNKAAAVAPGEMAGKGKRVVSVTTDSGALYRTSITGFTHRDQATALCERLKAAGGSCFVR